MNLPNYKNGSIVNLMSSLATALDGKSEYEPLKILDPSIFSGKNVVLIVVDGLGYEFLLKHGKGSFLEKHIVQKITSVFPATTATAVTALATGVPPQQHGLTGWFMHLKEIGIVAAILPFTSRAGHLPLGGGDIKMKHIFNQESFCAKIKATSYAIQHKDYVNSEYSIITTKGAKRLTHDSLGSFFKAIKKALLQKTGRKFVYAYWPKIDSFCHEKGTDSKEVLEHFYKLDKKIESFAKTLKNAVLIVTADHGLIDTKESEKIIEIKDHPEFASTLTLPLCGEPRVVFCYVKPSRTQQFEQYVKNNFAECCEMHKSEDLIKKNYFGLFKANPKLIDRVGDYTLIMKDNYIMKQFIEGQEGEIHIGNHGGVSQEEMFVPLIIISSQK